MVGHNGLERFTKSFAQNGRNILYYRHSQQAAIQSTLPPIRSATHITSENRQIGVEHDAELRCVIEAEDVGHTVFFELFARVINFCHRICGGSQLLFRGLTEPMAWKSENYFFHQLMNAARPLHKIPLVSIF